MSKVYLKNSWSYTGALPVFSFADNTAYYFWPNNAGLTYYTSVAIAGGFNRPILLTDVGYTKFVNTAQATLEPSQLYLVEMNLPFGTSYYSGIGGVPPTFRQEWLIHNNIQFANARYPHQYSTDVKIFLDPKKIYCMKLVTPTWVTNPTNVSATLTLNGMYLDLNPE